MVRELLPCPHCGASAIFMLESKSYSKKFGKKVQFARVICSNNKKFDYKDRCFCKTTAGEENEVIHSWNKRKSK